MLILRDNTLRASDNCKNFMRLSELIIYILYVKIYDCLVILIHHSYHYDSNYHNS